ncbi:DUF1992 domain-containing protein [Paenibacillus sp. NPDC058071]|uniref:DnaJ family domain-containing protein n=1 Tax=Paenibacillus sp. NPDC058071 TaxID=3346326 RepID=UPI0036DE115F
MEWAAIIAEQRIREAMSRGEFDELEGKGKPLQLEDMSHVPEDLRLGYKLLRNAGAVPEEMQLSKEIIGLRDLIALCTDDGERTKLRHRLSEKQLRYRMLTEERGWGHTSAFRQYESQITKKLEGVEL